MMLGQEGKPIPVTEWTLRYDGYSPREEGLREALCTTGNGYFATRGAAPELAADGTHYPGTYIAGCFNELRTEVAGRTVENECLGQRAELAPADLCREGRSLARPWRDGGAELPAGA
jgi:trehalose/maltose hydrolase-like predicted phosphorylase